MELINEANRYLNNDEEKGDVSWSVIREAVEATVVLLSPGAPSFGAYRDYVARGRHFAELAGFDPDSISAIPGLGIG